MQPVGIISASISEAAKYFSISSFTLFAPDASPQVPIPININGLSCFLNISLWFKSFIFSEHSAV